MSDYLLNTLFAEDLVEFNFKLVNRSWKATDGVHTYRSELGKSPFDPAIGLAFSSTYRTFQKEIQADYVELRTTGGVKGKVAFANYALWEAYECFTEGYTHECFLGYCVHVIGIAGLYHVFSVEDILDSAVQVVAIVLLSQQLTGQFYRRGGWNGLIAVSKKLNDCFASKRLRK